MKRFIFISVLVVYPQIVHAEQTIFNVPSAEVLDAKKVYIENDWQFRTWETVNGTSGTTFVRGMVGIGKNIEVGINNGPYSLIDNQNPFLDFSIKWRPVLQEIQGRNKSGAFAFYLGSNNGVGLSDSVQGKGRNFDYGMVSLCLPDLETRLGAGAYFSTKYIFGNQQAGFLGTFEQPLFFVQDLILAADWFSGDGATLTAGLIYNIKKIALYAGYSFANTGRADDIVTLEVGYAF